MRRVNAHAVYAALDQQRRARGWTWQLLAQEIGGFSPAMLTRLARGGRMGVDQLGAVAAWLGRTLESFTHATDW